MNLMTTLIEEFSKNNDNTIDSMESMLQFAAIMLSFIYLFIFLSLSLISYGIYNYGLLSLINPHWFFASLLTVCFSMFIVGFTFFVNNKLKENYKRNYMGNIKTLLIYIRTKKNIMIWFNDVEVRGVIKSDIQNNIDVALNGKNIELIDVAKSILIRYEEISNGDLSFFVKKGYYKKTALFEGDILAIEKRMEKHKLEKTSNCLENF